MKKTGMPVALLVLPEYGLVDASLTMEPFGSGLINHTWKVTTTGKAYILQRVNETVFTKPEAIAHNLREIAGYIQQHHPYYCFVAPLTSNGGSDLIFVKGEGFFRLFPFIEGSHAKNVVESTGQAFEAAKQFGRFTRMLSGMDVSRLRVTISSFHDLSLRYQQFLTVLKTGNPERQKACAAEITELLSYQSIVEKYEAIKTNPAFRLRVTHHDTKISNVLFDSHDKGICVIDLDTVMPGYFFSDLGDMMCTYLSPVSEEEQDLSKITVREDFYRAVVEGYYSEMKHELTELEQGSFFYAGQFMIYMQALRFLTDHLQNDSYYGARYEGHNLSRAQNQIVLLQQLLAREKKLCSI